MELYKLQKVSKGAFAIVALTAMHSCTLPIKKFPSELKERATLEFNYDDKSYKGIAVIPRRSHYNFTFKVPKNTSELAIKTCHREAFLSNKQQLSSVNYSYIPVAFLENWDACFLVASAHTKDGQRQFALIDFTSNETLQAKVFCNGNTQESTVTFCQASVGTQQMIVFKKPVKVKSKCKVPTGEHGEERTSRFYFNAEKGYCVYAFYANKDIHRLTVYGY